MAISHRARKDMQIRQLLKEVLLDKTIQKMKKLDDNEISLFLIRDLVSQNGIKYINVMYYHICRLIKNGKR